FFRAFRRKAPDFALSRPFAFAQFLLGALAHCSRPGEAKVSPAPEMNRCGRRGETRVMTMADLASQAASVGALLKERGETVAVAESSAGGLIAAALLAVPGASVYFMGGGVVYTSASKQ